MLNESISNLALEYLKSKQNIKGSEIVYDRIKLSEYLSPKTNLSIEDKRNLFAIRNRMVEIPDNFKTSAIENLCICKKKENI